MRIAHIELFFLLIVRRAKWKFQIILINQSKIVFAVGETFAHAKNQFPKMSPRKVYLYRKFGYWAIHTAKVITGHISIFSRW